MTSGLSKLYCCLTALPWALFVYSTNVAFFRAFLSGLASCRFSVNLALDPGAFLQLEKYSLQGPHLFNGIGSRFQMRVPNPSADSIPHRLHFMHQSHHGAVFCCTGRVDVQNWKEPAGMPVPTHEAYKIPNTDMAHGFVAVLISVARLL